MAHQRVVRATEWRKTGGLKDCHHTCHFRGTLENPGLLRDNGSVIAGQDWGNGRQTARHLGLRAHHRQEAGQTGEVSL